jgi:hypothetical protein
MATEKAERLNDTELANEIVSLESGEKKLILNDDENGRPVNVGLLILPVLKRTLQLRKERK